MNKLGTKLGAIAMSAVMALSFAPSAAITSLAADDGLDDAIVDSLQEVYVVYDENSGEHLWTTEAAEVSFLLKAGWSEGDSVWKAPTIVGEPVYRLYSPNSGEHHYTADKAEADWLVEQGWNNEKVAFLTPDPEDDGATPILCYRNPNGGRGAHQYTISEEEAAILELAGWEEENPRFYGYELTHKPGPEVEELTVSINNPTPKVGDTLSAIVVGADTVTYQWLADGTAITGETTSTLDVTSDMVGKKISVKVTSLDGDVATSIATAAVVKDLPKLKDADQVTANQILLEFDSDSSSIDADDITVVKSDDGLVIPVEKVEDYTDLDTTRIVATLSSALINDTDYSVTVGGITITFTASVGEVASITILTSEAEVNKPTKVEYKLLDKNGIDVTSTQKLKETVLVDITGTYKTAKTSDPTDVSVTMGEVGDACEVTISYSIGDGVTEAIEATKEITCVEPTAANGTKKYVKGGAVNANSGCAKFYLDGVGTGDLIKLAVNETADNIYFAAFDDNGDAISYDQYEVESANEKIVDASTTAIDSGKFAIFSLTGNEVGTTQVKVIATSNGVDREYYMNVSVRKPEDLVKVSLSSDRNQKLSNAYDVDYYDTITATIYDSSDNTDAIYEQIEWNLLNQDNYKESDKAPEGLRGKFGWVNGVGYDGLEEAEVEAWGAKAGKYTVQVTADFADFTKSATIGISVSELPENAWIGNAGATVKYMVDVDSPSVNNINGDNTIRLAAMVNNLFAGYVRQAEVAPENVADGDGYGRVLINGDFDWPDEATNYKTDAMVATAAAVNTNALKVALDGNTDDGDYENIEAIPTQVILYDDNGETVGTYNLHRHATSDELEGVAWGDDELGGYCIVDAGNAVNGGEITIGEDLGGNGTVQANMATTIANGTLKWTMQFGVKKLATGTLYRFVEQAGDATALYVEEIEAITDAWGQADDNAPGAAGYLTYVGNDNSYDYDIARAGKYTVKFTFVNRNTFKTETAQNEFTVKDVLASLVPEVTLLTKTTTGYDLNSLKEIVSLNVDLNNNEGSAESLVEPGLITKWTAKDDQDGEYDGDATHGYFDVDQRVGISSGDAYAKYAIVKETYKNTGILIYYFVPVGAKIKES